MNCISSNRLYQMTGEFFKNLQALIGVVGIVGNVLVVCVFSRKRFDKITYSIYFIAMAINDCLIHVNTFRHWSRAFLRFNLDLFAPPLFCKLNDYVAHVAGLSSLIFTTVLLVDRFVKITHLNRPSVFQRKWFQISLIAAVFIHSSTTHSVLVINYKYDALTNIQLGSNFSPINMYVCSLPLPFVQLNALVVLANTALLIAINTILYAKLFSFINKSGSKIRSRNNSLLTRDLKFVSVSVVITLLTFTSKLALGFAAIIAGSLGLTLEQNEMVFAVCVTFAVLSNASLFPINYFLNIVFNREFTEMLKSRNKIMCRIRIHW